MNTGPFLIVPDNDPDKEFKVVDLAEAHAVCRERGHKKFDVWTVPGEKKIIGYTLSDGRETGYVGDLWLAENAHRLRPDITAKPALYDDGSTMIEADVTVQ